MRLADLSLTIVLSACGASSPPAGAVLLSHTPTIPQSVTLGAPTERSEVVTLTLGGSLEFRSKVAEAVDGGRYITEVVISVRDAAGFEMSASPMGAPTNQGTGTGSEVRMTQGFMVSQNKAGATGRTGGQTLVTVMSDGSIELR